jgi:hypothetical protein
MKWKIVDNRVVQPSQSKSFPQKFAQIIIFVSFASDMTFFSIDFWTWLPKVMKWHYNIHNA